MENTEIRSRQAELVDSTILTQPITLIGCGAIGSFTALTLAKMGFHTLKVYDNDDVSTENISNQFYRYSDIGSNKALALWQMLRDFEDINVQAYSCLWNKTHPLSSIVIMCVDSMTARKTIFNKVCTSRSVRYFIDGRMGGQQAEVYAFENVPEQRDVYTRYLWDEAEASELRCTQKAVMYNVLWIASNIANTLRLMLEGKAHSRVTYMDFENQVQQTLVLQ